MKHVKNLKVRIAALVLASSTMFTLTGCLEPELAPDESYDIVGEMGEDNFMGLTQVLDIPGRDFKLVTQYSCDDSSKRAWRITSDKFLYISVQTQGLPEGTLVYIDNIHIDTSIKSKYAAMDGILQDSMDDHVHSSQLIGFPISDSLMYYGVNAIEGCNDSFIKASFYGFKGYGSSSIEEERYTESDYIDRGVYANKIQIVYDLLIKGPNDKDFSNVSVATDFLVPVTQKTQVKESSEITEETQKTK